MVRFVVNRMNGEFLITYPPDQNGVQDSFGIDAYNFPGILINPTGPLGFISLLYVKTMLQLPKFGYGVFKYADRFEINPTYREYYASTIAQKQDLETKIKAGLESASRAISDYELLAHDHRKYQDYLDYLNRYEKGAKDLAKAKKENNEEAKKKAERDILESNTSLKAIFIDQVDVHTGEGVALKLIVSRWPNIIVDFMKLQDSMTASEDIVKDFVPKITTAEAVVLATKNKLFLKWKDLFKGAVKQRYLNILSLMNARRKSIEQYKKWLRPYVIQHELLQESHEKASDPSGASAGADGVAAKTGGRAMTHRLHVGAHAMSFHDIATYAWKPFAPGDMYRASVQRKEIDVELEYLGKKKEERAEDEAILKRFGLSYRDVEGGKTTTTFWLNPYDVVAKVALYGDKHGSKRGRVDGPSLIEEHPWIKPKEMEAQVVWLLKESTSQPKTYQNTLQLHPDYIYYVLWDLTFARAIINLPQGTADDGFVFIKIAFISQNVLLVKLVERWASEQRFDRDVEEVLGLTAIDENEKIDAGITGNMEDVAKKKFPELYAAEKKDDGKKEEFDIVKSVDHRLNEMQNFLEIFIGSGNRFQFFKKGPYETNLRDRITRQFSKAFADTYRDEFISWFEGAARIGD
ncbi:MAG: hypothetical protein HYS53_02765 [Candidatus Aenigmarchaeota archaeon]|nr:hypothetical protein [Candidatus Aenigmarchaeota archaeon]